MKRFSYKMRNINLNHIDVSCIDSIFCSLPKSKESVEWVSMRGLESGGFVLVKEKKHNYIAIRLFVCYTIKHLQKTLYVFIVHIYSVAT